MSYYTQPGFYRSMLGISEVDTVSSFEIDTTNITTQNLTVSSLGSGLVSSATGVLQNAIIGTGLSYSNVTNTLNNTGLTSISSGQTGPVYISTSSTGSVHIALPQNLTPTSSVDFFTVTTLGDVNCGGYLYSGAVSGGGSNNSLAVIDEGTVYSLGGNIISPIQYNFSEGLRVSLAGSTGIDYTVRGNTGYITNKGVTSITSGQTGPVYISQSSTGSVHIALPQNLTPTSGVEFFSVTTLGDVNSGGYLYSGGLSGGGTNNSLAVIDEGTIYSLGGNIISPIQYNFSGGLRLSLTGSTGIDYTVRGNTGYISNTSLGPTGPTGPGGTIGFYANYYSTTTQSIGTSAQQITFPNHFVQNGISLDGNNNIVFSASGTYKITTLLQVNGSNNARFHHWYRYNGVDVNNSAFEDHFSSGAGQVLSTSSGLITVNAGDTLGLWGVKTAGTINITYTPGSVSPVYPASTSVNVVVSQETYTQIGPTGYTGPMGPTYTAGTNINVSGSNVISTVTNPQFERVLNSTLALRTVLLGNSSGGSITSGGVDCVGVGHNTLSSLTTGGSSTACGSQSLRNVTTGGSNTACGFNALNSLQTGSQNTAVGAFAGSNITTGSFNTLMGMSAGGNLTTGSTNFHLGLNSGFSSLSSSDNISIGAYSMARNLNKMTGPDGRNLAIGHYSSHSLEGYPTNNVSIGYNSMYNATQASDNICIGTNSGNSIRTGGANICIGGSSTTVGNLTGGQGLNIGLGIASNLYLTGSAANNIGIGGYSNLNTTSGNNNISIGPATQASSATSSNEITISTNGTISVPVSGKGANTAFIDARNGLYSYIPGYWWGYAQNQMGGFLRWNTFTNRAIVRDPTDSTKILCPTPGLYEFNLSGSIYNNVSTVEALSMRVNGGLYLNRPCYYFNNMGNTGWQAISLSALVYVNNNTTYIQYEMTANLLTDGNAPTILTAKYCGL